LPNPGEQVCIIRGRKMTTKLWSQSCPRAVTADFALPVSHKFRQIYFNPNLPKKKSNL
jgi:hypothetical protein